MVAFLKDYINPKGLKTLIKIRSRMAQKWLNQLGYKYRNIKKDVFIDGHERPDVVEDWKVFLKTMSDLESYFIEFDLEEKMKGKVYPDNF